MRRVFVTGLAGYLGGAVAEVARARGDEVRGTVFRTPAAGGVVVDVRDPEAVAAAVRAAAPDLVVHTAYRQDDPPTCADGAAHVAAAARAAGARLVHVSTDMVFSGRLGRPLHEGDAIDPITPYGAAKADGEERVLAHDPRALVVRTSLLYGGPERPGPQERLALDPAATFFTDEVRSPVRVDRLAHDLLALAATPARGVLHVGGPDDLDRLQLARRLAELCGGRDPDALRGAPGPPDRPKHLALNSSAARRLLRSR